MISNSSCERSHQNSSGVKENSKLVELGELQVELKHYYEKIEDDLRKSNGIEDQAKIDIMMQIFINDGDIDASFIVEEEEGVPQIKYVSYSEYKKYYSTHGLDTTKVFYITFDSLGKIRKMDTLK